VRDFMLELVRAVEYLHANGVYHRDIKPENIFLTSDASMKLGDFGLATTDTWSTEFAVGSDRYMAPEQYDASVYGYGYSPAACDIWAIGIVLLNVLFQRNPFATPSQKDVLFADFARDRQSLFDIFPNMSQDTFNVLLHSLALDPANRSLTAVKDALQDVVSFTIDDETLDDFCTEQGDAVPVTATAAREPLRTPSLSTAVTPVAGGDSFPWAAALLKTPQKSSRQLSTIPDEDDLFPGAGSDWQYVDTDEASLSSNLDSGLGLSYKSAKSMNTMHSALSIQPKPSKISFVGSLPISFSRPKTSPYGGSGFSKSWSDLYDEEAEAVQADVVPLEDAGVDIERVSTAKPSTPQLQSLQDDGRGSVTPRAGLVDIDANVRSATPLAITEERPSIVKQKSSSILDKWAALGNFRRARTEAAPAATTSTTAPVATPPKSNKYTGAFSNFTSFGSSKKPKAQWRQAGSGSPQRLRSNSFLDNDWRRRSSSSSRLEDLPIDLDKEDQDVEWVGGWRDFQL
jgi:serine/threonine protein kinase